MYCHCNIGCKLYNVYNKLIKVCIALTYGLSPDWHTDLELTIEEVNEIELNELIVNALFLFYVTNVPLSAKR